MNKVINPKDHIHHIPIMIWGEDPEEGAMEQAFNLAKLRYAFHHIALMPDVHQGYGMPIGGVMATKDVIVPNAVGVDIGCGMRAVQTDFKAKDIEIEDIKKILGKIREIIPVGFNHHKEKQKHEIFDDAPDIPIIQAELENAKGQLGTLGGGNHFIELQAGSDGFLWLMLHSGSRNFGYKIAREYHNKAKALCERWFSDIPHPDLSFLPMQDKAGEEYLDAMNYALKFAHGSRRLMMKQFVNIAKEVLGVNIFVNLDIHHNYAQIEHHFGSDVIVHRKGAILARKGNTGIIPGSQGTASYITEGLGNERSFNSSSHGAGRRMGRKQAQRELNLKEQIKKLDNAGVVHSIRNEKDLDEAPDAYKDIDEVMKAQEDLCEIKVNLKPLGVVKA